MTGACFLLFSQFMPIEMKKLIFYFVDNSSNHQNDTICIMSFRQYMKMIFLNHKFYVKQNTANLMCDSKKWYLFSILNPWKLYQITNFYSDFCLCKYKFLLNCKVNLLYDYTRHKFVTETVDVHKFIVSRKCCLIPFLTETVSRRNVISSVEIYQFNA